MCGIAGYVTTGNHAEVLAAALPAATNTLAHRGPDDVGIWIGQGVGLGHRRLSILDLSPHGHQPMFTEDGRYAMVFNGEVYNFRSIRAELQELGHRFAGTGDSEVVLAAFAQWGPIAVQRFIGMFAIALWDNQARTLTLIRDRLGVKPLYYGHNRGTLWFGSELKALRAFPHWQHEIDRAALGEYLQFGYINAPRSIYRNVSKVKPGYWVQLDREGARIEHCYWSVLDALAQPLTGTEDELADELETLLTDAFSLRMVSDVPVGVFLSGGVDSSLLAALLQKGRKDDPIHTFTIGFNEAHADESVHAKRVAAHLGTIHTERILDTDEAKCILPGWAKLYDEPFADSSGIPTYLVSRMAGEQVKVVLSADGGDELFSGYNSYTSVLHAWERKSRIPTSVRRAAVAALKLAPMSSIDAVLDALPLPSGMYRLAKTKSTWKARCILDWADEDKPGGFFENTSSFFQGHEIAALLGDYQPVRPHSDDYPGALADQLCLWDLHHYLPGDILTKVDRATMAVSIEGREPLLDHRVAEYAFRLPLAMRRGRLGPKHILKRLLYKHVPREIVDRPKQGFAIPLGSWLKGDLRHLVDEYLEPSRVRREGVIDAEVASRVVRGFLKGNDKLTNQVWALLAFQMWHEAWG